MSKETKKPEKPEVKKTEKTEQPTLSEKVPEKEEKSEKPVLIKAEAYKTIILFANRYANHAIPQEEWKEIYGILIGKSDDDFVYVERAEALAYGHSTDVELDHKHYGFIEEITNKLEAESKGYYMVGWFHSHPGFGLFYSFIDLKNQLNFQLPNPDFMGLVFDYTILGKKKEEKIEGEDGQFHTITKFDTGFEIYRINDVNMDLNSPNFDNNYHSVDYIVDGLNKFFFANVLTELSALVAAGKPLQSAYGEEYEIKPKSEQLIRTTKKEPRTKIVAKKEVLMDKKTLGKIPISPGVIFDTEDSFYVERKKENSPSEMIKEAAEQLIFEGNQAFNTNDAFTGIEKYRKGIEKYKEINDYDRILDLYRFLTEQCLSSNHNVFAQEFVEELYKLANNRENLFYKAEAIYMKGYLLLKDASDDKLEAALTKIQDSTIVYEKAGDFAGAGKAYNRIGSTYQSRLNQLFSACLFYLQAVKSYKRAIQKGYPLRKSVWSKPEALSQKILELKDTIEEILPNLEKMEEKEKISTDLKSITFNS